MKPVTIRYLGLIPIRKRTYLILQSIILVLGGVWIIVGLILMISKPFRFDPATTPPTTIWIYDHILHLGVLATVAEILDAIFTLRAFRRKEAEEKLRYEAKRTA